MAVTVREILRAKRDDMPRWEVSSEGRVVGWVRSLRIGHSSVRFYEAIGIDPRGEQGSLECGGDRDERVRVVVAFHEHRSPGAAFIGTRGPVRLGARSGRAHDATLGAMTDRVWQLNSEVLAAEWAEPYGLREMPRHGDHVGIAGLIDGRSPTLVVQARRLDREETPALIDHDRTFRKPDGTRPVVVVTAPYLRATIAKFGSADAANARVHAIAEVLGLRVRVGHPADTIYLSNRDNDPTLPIVWWNPDRIDLPFPIVADPNPRFADRMAR